MDVTVKARFIDTCVGEIGGKGRALKTAKQAGCRVPQTLVVCAEELQHVLRQYRWQDAPVSCVSGDSFDEELQVVVRNLLADMSMRVEPEGELAAWTKTTLIARSSSVLKPEHAPAISGCYDSVECPSLQELGTAVKSVWLSLFSKSAYVQNQLIPRSERTAGMAVLVQPYLEPIVSGLVHSKLGKPGAESAELDVVWMQGHLRELVRGKTSGWNVRVRPEPDDGSAIVIGQEFVLQKCIDDGMAPICEELACHSCRLAEAFASDVEIEWLHDGRELWIVQVQPLNSSQGNRGV